MMGYDTLLSSYYDHYVLDYELFEPWHFNYTTLQIPTGRAPFEEYTSELHKYWNDNPRGKILMFG